MNKTIHILSLLVMTLASCSSDKPEFEDKLFNEIEVNGVTWMDRNIGAKTPEDFGGYFQWGRPADGHQNQNSETTSTLSKSNNPGHGMFILNSNGENWQENPVFDLSQLANVCPDGWRLPSASEFEDLIPYLELGELNGVEGAIYKELFFPRTGSRSCGDGRIYKEEDYPLDPVVTNICTSYQTSSVSTYEGGGSLITFDFVRGYDGKYSYRTSTTGVFAEGLPVRCVKK